MTPIVENTSYLTDKYVNLRSGTILIYFRFILENYDRIFKLTPEFSKVGGVSCLLVKMQYKIFCNYDLFRVAKR